MFEDVCLFCSKPVESTLAYCGETCKALDGASSLHKSTDSALDNEHHDEHEYNNINLSHHSRRYSRTSHRASSTTRGDHQNLTMTQLLARPGNLTNTTRHEATSTADDRTSNAAAYGYPSGYPYSHSRNRSSLSSSSVSSATSILCTPAAEPFPDDAAAAYDDEVLDAPFSLDLGTSLGLSSPESPHASQDLEEFGTLRDEITRVAQDSSKARSLSYVRKPSSTNTRSTIPVPLPLASPNFPTAAALSKRHSNSQLSGEHSRSHPHSASRTRLSNSSTSILHRRAQSQWQEYSSASTSESQSRDLSPDADVASASPKTSTSQPLSPARRPSHVHSLYSAPAVVQRKDAGFYGSSYHSGRESVASDHAGLKALSYTSASSHIRASSRLGHRKTGSHSHKAEPLPPTSTHAHVFATHLVSPRKRQDSEVTLTGRSRSAVKSDHYLKSLNTVNKTTGDKLHQTQNGRVLGKDRAGQSGSGMAKGLGHRARASLPAYFAILSAGPDTLAKAKLKESYPKFTPNITAGGAAAASRGGSDDDDGCDVTCDDDDDDCAHAKRSTIPVIPSPPRQRSMFRGARGMITGVDDGIISRGRSRHVSKSIGPRISRERSLSSSSSERRRMSRITRRSLARTRRDGEGDSEFAFGMDEDLVERMRESVLHDATSALSDGEDESDNRVDRYEYGRRRLASDAGSALGFTDRLTGIVGVDAPERERSGHRGRAREVERLRSRERSIGSVAMMEESRGRRRQRPVGAMDITLKS